MKVISEKEWNDLAEYRDSLEHYGVKGMKWGVQKERKSSGTKRKKRTFSEKTKARRAQRAKDRVARAKARAEKQEAEAKKKAEKAAAKAEKRRKQILSNPTSLYKHRKEFTAEEIQAAMKQFEWEKKLGDYSAQRLKNGADFVNTIFTYSNNAINLYNNAARLVNSLDDNSNLPVIKTTKEILEDKKNKKSGDKR